MNILEDWPSGRKVNIVRVADTRAIFPKGDNLSEVNILEDWPSG